jgi:GNAT superfamily N-acetyltransferase
MAEPSPRLRTATLEDQAVIDALMKTSIRALFPTYYDERQTASSVIYVGHADSTLISDGTYLVVEANGEIVACGGWSKRDKLYTGSADQERKSRLLDPATEPARIRAMFVRGDRIRRGLGTLILEACEAAAREAGFVRLSLVATLPGFPLYEKYGFQETARTLVNLPDGVQLECVAMEKDVAR